MYPNDCKQELKKPKMIEKIYNNNTRIGLALIALLIFFFKSIRPDFTSEPESYLIPIFIIVVLIELYILNNKIDKNQDKTSSIRYFTSGEEFDTYLRKRLKSVEDLKIVHFSEGGVISDPHPSKRSYVEILDAYIMKGNRFQRIFADTKSDMIFKDTKSDFNRYKNLRYFSYLLESIEVKEGRFENIMIIDNEEVCLGGGYTTTAKFNTISIKDNLLTGYYIDYFDILKSKSIPLRTEHKILFEKIEEKISEKQQLKHHK